MQTPAAQHHVDRFSSWSLAFRTHALMTPEEPSAPKFLLQCQAQRKHRDVPMLKVLLACRKQPDFRAGASRSVPDLACVAGVGLAQHSMAEAGDDAAAVQGVPHKLLHLLLGGLLPNLRAAGKQ